MGGEKENKLGQILEKETKRKLLDQSLKITFRILEVNPLNLLSFLLKFWSKSLSVFQAIGCKSISSFFILIMQWFD